MAFCGRLMAIHPILPLRGKGGVPWVQIMENEFECIGDRKGHDGHLAKKF